MIAGSLSGGKFSDIRRSRTLARSSDGTVNAENRLFDQIWGVLICSAGCLMYGWFLEFNISAAAVLVATFLGTMNLKTPPAEYFASSVFPTVWSNEVTQT